MNLFCLPVAAVLFLAAGSAFGQDALSLSSGSVVAGQSISLDLSLTAPASGGPAGLQWTYSYPAATFSSVAVVAGPAAVAAGKSVSCNGGSGSYTCMLFGMNNTTLSSGAVATATFTVSPVAAGMSSPIQVLNSTGVTLGGTPVSVAATGGQVNITSLYSLTGLTCSPATVTIPGSAACTVTLSASTPAGGLTVTTGVASQSSVTIPSSVVVPAGSNSASFSASVAAGSTSAGLTANLSAVTAKTTAVLSASLNGTSQNFTLALTNTAAPIITASAGAPQTTIVNTTFATGLQATVKDGSNNPVSGVTVTFMAPGSGASATFGGSATVAVVTNASGIALSPVPVANGVVGTYYVSASALGLTAVTFALTNSAVSSTGTAAFLKMDTTTQGNWKSVYGKDGSNVIGDGVSNPSYVTPVASGQSSYTWVASTSDRRALQKATNPADRIAATWFSTTPFTIDMNISDTATHQVALYFVDWDSSARRQTVAVLNASGTVLSTQSLTSSFNGGVYLLWNVSGHVQFRITRNAGANAVVSGLFFDVPLNATGTATFVKMDAATQGNWKSVYGADGYNVIGNAVSNPSYVTPVPSGQLSAVWANSTSDTRALQKATNPADRIAATWDSQKLFTIDMNISDTATHQVALYFVDWDSTARRQTVDVLNASGTVLNTQALASSFNGGVYLVWNVSGHVQFRITRNAGANAVVSGMFFKP